ncbi:hypothetical protein MPNT_280001 [Candidatus Methylacidithermus pantelleriae]|uniref:Uncharacterized protein n=1 Tax=Candidatus Methylacidithermus pantelleriae TaxID=2744239 RepID=A0A8J2BP72_9BACT|nr:hypothetical protein MPNT_280001 [Candidatus Methylacidithermus pantelleriae]
MVSSRLGDPLGPERKKRKLAQFLEWLVSFFRDLAKVLGAHICLRIKATLRGSLKRQRRV